MEPKFNIGDIIEDVCYTDKSRGIITEITKTYDDHKLYVVNWISGDRVGQTTSHFVCLANYMWNSLVDNGSSNKEATDKVAPVVNLPFSSSQQGLGVNKPECAHLWKDYFGLTESYRYCEKCDEKQSGGGK